MRLKTMRRMRMIKVKKLHEDAIIPKFAKDGDAGRDLYTLKDTIILPNQTKVVPTGIAIQLSKKDEAEVRPRSGISLNGCKECFKLEYDFIDKVEIKTSASPYLWVKHGTIDSNYTGDIGIITYNQENYPVLIPKGTRLAQLVINTSVIDNEDLELVEELNKTNRGDKGFGSTGTK
jgi:dUTP pyrophosphatase